MRSPGERTPYDHRVNSESPPCSSQRQSLSHQPACFGGVNLVQPGPAQAEAVRAARFRLEAYAAYLGEQKEKLEAAGERVTRELLARVRAVGE